MTDHHPFPTEDVAKSVWNSDQDQVPYHVLREAIRLLEFWAEEPQGPDGLHLVHFIIRPTDPQLDGRFPEGTEPTWTLITESVEEDGTEHDEYQIISLSGELMAAVSDGIG